MNFCCSIISKPEINFPSSYIFNIILFFIKTFFNTNIIFSTSKSYNLKNISSFTIITSSIFYAFYFLRFYINHFVFLRIISFFYSINFADIIINIFTNIPMKINIYKIISRKKFNKIIISSLTIVMEWC
jgi:hypothetical protein